MLCNPPFVLLTEPTNVQVILSSWKYESGIEERLSLWPSVFGGDQHRATAVQAGRVPQWVSKVTGNETHGLNLETCHLLRNRWRNQPRSLQRHCQRGRRSTSRAKFQKPSKKRVSRGIEWSIKWTVYIKWSAEGLAWGKQPITSGCKCHEDGRSDDGEDNVSVLYCFFFSALNTFPSFSTLTQIPVDYIL